MLGDVCQESICDNYLKQILINDFLSSVSLIPGWEYFGYKRQAVLLSFAWNFGSDFYKEFEYKAITEVLDLGFQYPEKYQEVEAVLNLYIKDKDVILPGLVNRRSTEGAMWNQESDGIMNFVSRKPTLLKRAPISSRYLSPSGKVECKEGELISVSRLEEIPGESHAWVQFEGATEKWAIYLPDWREKRSRALREEDDIDWSDFSCPIGKYLSVGEVLQYDARRAPESGSDIEKTLINTCHQFDSIRSAWKEAIGVVSFYRPEPINRECGGSETSQHVSGTAIDIFPVNGSLDKFHMWLVQRWSGGYGDYRSKGFIHLDTRNGGGFKGQPSGKPESLWGF